MRQLMFGLCTLAIPTISVSSITLPFQPRYLGKEIPAGSELILISGRDSAPKRLMAELRI
jgi:hypothetical protein